MRSQPSGRQAPADDVQGRQNRVGSGQAEGDEYGAGDHGQRDEAVDSGVVSVGDQRWAVQSGGCGAA
ncbi:MAG: hypothetical protein QOJ20_3190 [Mycobacterium sp.]|nr:hypothetical protein [Mycobacterium sp.]